MDTHADLREFQPALVRLQELPPSPLGRRMLWAELIFLAAMLAWAVFGRLDIVAVAEGRLVPDTDLKIVQLTAESFAQTVNQLKDKVTMLFIAHQFPRGLQVDEVLQFGTRGAATQPPTQMRVIEEDKSRP